MRNLHNTPIRLPLLLLITLLFNPLVASESITAGFTGDLRAFFFSGDRKDRQDREALAVGGIFKYVSNEYEGLSAAAAWYSSHDLLKRGSEPTDRINNGLLITDNSDIGGNSGLVCADGHAIDTLGEAYIQYRLHRTRFRIGRQRIHTPLVDDYYNRFLPNSFEALWIEDTSLSDTTIQAALIDRWKYKETDHFSGIAEGIGLNRNLYLAGILNRTLPDMTLQMWIARLPDAFQTLYGSIQYQFALSASNQWQTSIDLQYLDQRDQGEAVLGPLDSYLAGMRIDLTDKQWLIRVMADQVGRDTIRGSGADYANLGLSRYINYTDIQIDGEALNAGALSYGLMLQRRFNPSFRAALLYLHIDQDTERQLASATPNRRPDSNEYNLDMTCGSQDYGQLRLRLARIDYAADPLITNEYDETNIRLIYDYHFSVSGAAE